MKDADTLASPLASPLLLSNLPSLVTQLQCLHRPYCEHKHWNQFTSTPTASGIS